MLGLYLAIVGLMAGLIFVIAPPTIVKPTTGPGITFLAYLLIVFSKVLLDDSAHFADKIKNGENWAHGIGFCILWNLFTLNAIRLSVDDFHLAIICAVLAQLIGTIWI
jgi:hypothetical protein